MKIKLYCLAFAGGSANNFLRMKPLIHEQIEMIPLEYAGRGRRFTSPICTTIEEIAEDIYKLIKPSEGPYAYFAHSMGTAVVMELLRITIARGAPLPVHLFLSGRNSPKSAEKSTDYHRLEDEDFIKAIEKLGGTNPEVFKNNELKEIFLPILKADFKAIETYAFTPLPEDLDLPFTIFYGTQDHVITREGINDWLNLTKGSCDFHPFHGGHMYLFDDPQPVITIINQTLAII